MNTSLLVNISGQTYQRVDIFEDIPISLVIQQSDLTDLTGRRVPYSKTITIPDTANNAKVFEHYFEVNGLDFNPLNKIPCIVQYRGTDIFTGVLRLNAVIEQNYSRLYEVYILGEVSDFFSQVRDLTLQQLDWYDLTHELTYDNIVTSWEAKAGTTDGLLNGDIIYPLINYGLDYQGTTGTTAVFHYDFDKPNGFDNPLTPVTTNSFKPAVRIKKVVDKIFEKTEYKLKSDFFDSDYFNALYMDTFQNGKLGITTAEDVVNENIYKTYTQPSFTYFFDYSNWTYRFNFSTLRTTGYDPLNNFTLGTPFAVTSPPPQTNINESFFRVPYNGEYFWNFRFSYDGVGNIIDQFVNFRISARKGFDINTLDTQPPFYVSPTYFVNRFTPDTDIDLYFSGNCFVGEYVALYFEITTGGPGAGGRVNIKPFTTPLLTEPAPMWELYASPLFNGNNVVDISLGINNINSVEFMKGLITMFNLIVIQDENSRDVRLEPYNWYYNDTERPVQDWTQRIDRSQEYRISPLSFELSKQNVWTYEYTDNEFLPKEFWDNNQFVYGRYKYISTNNILAGEQEYVVPFGSCPTSGVTGAPNFIIPKYYYFNNNQELPYADQPHLFFWVGNRYAYKDQFKTVQGTWYLQSGFTSVAQTTYPCVNHLSSLDIQIPELISDTNFASTFDFFGNSNTQIPQFTPYNLYNLYWDDYITNIYSPQTRRLQCRVFFNPIEVYETSLRDRIWVKDAYYTIEKINEADLVNRKLTEVSLIKDTVNYYKVIPPSPIYALEPNTPYPGVEPLFITTCYVGFDGDEVCNGTAPIINIYTFGSGTLQNFRKVYYDSGTALVLLPMGNYLRQTTSPDRFVVADTYGRIIESNC
jgi:hypothetical protein